MQNSIFKFCLVFLVFGFFAPLVLAATTPVNPTNNVLIKDLGPGTFPDVTWFQGKLWVSVQQGDEIKLYSGTTASNLTVVKSFALSDESGTFSRLTVSGGTLWLAYRYNLSQSSAEIRLWRKDKNKTESFPGGSGIDPIALGSDQIAWQAFDENFTVFIRALEDDEAEPTEARAGAPTGISRILPDGQVVLIDFDRNLVSWGTRAWPVGNLVVAEGPSGGVIGRFNDDKKKEFKLFGNQESFTPHAAFSGNQFAVATWGKPHVRVATFTSSLGTQEETKKIPPFEKSASVSVPSDGLPTDLGSLIVAVFQWSFRILGVVIFVRFFWAGFMWFTSAGNSSTIGRAQSIMKQAALGAFILFAAYLILITINPDFVSGQSGIPAITIDTKTASTSEEVEENLPCNVPDAEVQYQDAVDEVISEIVAKPEIGDLPNTRENLGKFRDAVIAELKANEWKVGRVSKTCDPNGTPGSEALIIGTDSDDYGEVCDLSKGVDNETTPIKEVGRADCGEHSEWVRLLED